LHLVADLTGRCVANAKVVPKVSFGICFAFTPPRFRLTDVFYPTEDNLMHPLQAAAHFDALLWYLRTHRDASRADAAWFAKVNWAEFLPAAHEGMGKLLLKLVMPRSRRGQRSRRKPSRLKLGLIS
jgi:hypothetical protein